MRGTGGGPLLQSGGGGFLGRGGGVLKKLVEVLKEFDPLPSTLSVSPQKSRQCGPKVPGRFAFPGAQNPRISSISRFGLSGTKTQRFVKR